MTSVAEVDDSVVELARGLMSSFNPVEAGGVEPSFAAMIETWIEMARQDGSFGWIGIANLPSSFAAAAYLPDDGFAEVFTAHGNHVTMGGQFFPNGQGVAVPGHCVIAGVDDSKLNDWIASWLPSVHIPYDEYGAAIFEQLQNVWSGAPAGDKLLPHRLIDRLAIRTAKAGAA